MARPRVAAPVGDSGIGSGTRCKTDVDEDDGGRGARDGRGVRRRWQREALTKEACGADVATRTRGPVRDRKVR